MVLGRKGFLDGDDQLGQHWQQLVGVPFNQLVSPLSGQELIGLLCLSESLEENWQMQMVVQVFGLHFPGELPECSMEADSHGEVSSIVILLEESWLLQEFTIDRKIDTLRS